VGKTEKEGVDRRAVAIKAVFTILDRWGIPKEDRLPLLHIASMDELNTLPLEKLVVFVTIHRYALGLLGEDRAYLWMTNPNRDFDGKTPAEHCIENEGGAHEVESYLARFV
jgi:uncharacterized protein (DUF2384 family)